MFQVGRNPLFAEEAAEVEREERREEGEKLPLLPLPMMSQQRERVSVFLLQE